MSEQISWNILVGFFWLCMFLWAEHRLSRIQFNTQKIAELLEREIKSRDAPGATASK